mgnify:CR=1 FL=1
MTPEEALKFLGFLALVEELDEEEEEWYEYYVTREGGYFGSEYYDEQTALYYSQSSDDENDAIAQFESDVGEAPSTLYGYQTGVNPDGTTYQYLSEGGEISVDVRKVPKDEVDDSSIL